MSDSLILKYRPQAFDEVLGQDVVVKSLQSVIASRRAHSFLFSGPSGTGKTTLARICASEVGCIPANIAEIDAATYTGIDAMRGVTNGLMYRPIGASPVKVIIVDECHALSKEAWRSILKATEEPPDWVYWFLCTTELTKVPDTIKTRCAAYQLQSVPKSELDAWLCQIAELEGFFAERDGGPIIDLCAKEAFGSPRLALSNLAVAAEAENRAEAAVLLHAAVGGVKDAVELARLLLKGAPWIDLKGVIEGLRSANPESVRIEIRNYISAVVLNAEKEATVGRGIEILDAFSQPCFPGDGLAPLLVAVGRATFR